MLAVILGLILGFVHYFSDKIHVNQHLPRMKTMSFTAGIFITYLFLHLLPFIYYTELILNRMSLFFVLIGFSLFYVIERYVYKQKKRKKDTRKELKEIHATAFFVYHFVIGIVLVSIMTNMGFLACILFFVPVLLHTAISSLSMKEIHDIITEKKSFKLILSVSTLLGILTAFLIPITSLIYYLLLGFVIGVLLYIVIMDSLPPKKEGEPLFFILGVILYMFILGLTWAF